MMLSTWKVVGWEMSVLIHLFNFLNFLFDYFYNLCSPSCSMYDLALQPVGLLVLLANSVHLDPRDLFLVEEEETGGLVLVGA